MSAIGDALKKSGKPALEIEIGKGPPDSDGEESSESEGDSLEASPEEVEAMKEYEAASSPEDKAMALKAFVKLCY